MTHDELIKEAEKLVKVLEENNIHFIIGMVDQERHSIIENLSIPSACYLFPSLIRKKPELKVLFDDEFLQSIEGKAKEAGNVKEEGSVVYSADCIFNYCPTPGLCKKDKKCLKEKSK